MGRTVFSIDGEEKVLPKQCVYDEQSGQPLYSQVQGRRDSIGNEYGELERLCLSREKKALRARKVRR